MQITWRGCKPLHVPCRGLRVSLNEGMQWSIGRVTLHGRFCFGSVMCMNDKKIDVILFANVISTYTILFSKSPLFWMADDLLFERYIGISFWRCRFHIGGVLLGWWSRCWSFYRLRSWVWYQASVCWNGYCIARLTREKWRYPCLLSWSE